MPKKVLVCRKFFLIIFLFFISIAVYPQQTRYSFDDGKPKSRHHLISLRRILHPNKAARAARKAQRKDARKKRKLLRQEKKAKKKYWKVYNKDKEKRQEGNRTVYRRMKQHKRKAKRVSSGKNPDPWYKRIFKKKHRKIKA